MKNEPFWSVGHSQQAWLDLQSMNYFHCPSLPRLSNDDADSGLFLVSAILFFVPENAQFIYEHEEIEMINKYKDRSRNLSRGLTLIEALVVISVIGSLIVLLLPAVMNARETARRSRCTNNLKQIGLAAALYEGLWGCYPMGSPIMNYPEQGIDFGHSVFVAILPGLEQQVLFNSVNFYRDIYFDANFTVQAAGLSVLWCPGDSGVQRAGFFGTNSPYGAIKTTMFSSYSGNGGIYYQNPSSMTHQGVSQLTSLNTRCTGIFFPNSSTRTADIGDGLSNTILFGEHSHSKLPDAIRDYWQWWFDGGVDSIFAAWYPINPWGRINPDSDIVTNFPDAYILAASSYHIGGSNFLFSDGHVQFIKDSISTMPFDNNGRPVGIFGDFAGYTQNWIGIPPPGVYQKLCSKNSGEITDANEY